MSKYKIEKGEGIPLIRDNLFVSDLTDMEMLEFWEDRLDALRQPYVVAYRKYNGRIVYSIFTRIRNKESAFK